MRFYERFESLMKEGRLTVAEVSRDDGHTLYHTR